MDSLILLAFIAIVILLYNIRNGQRASAAKTLQDIALLKKQLTEITKALSGETNNDTIVKPGGKEGSVWRPQQSVTKQDEIIKPAPPVFQEPLFTEEVSEVTHPVATSHAPVPRQTRSSIPPTPVESWWQRWLKNNPDLEKFIGENLVNKIGIAVLVLGIAFFVKYAIDQNWISEPGRVSIGIACGMILIGIAHYLRNNYRSFSSVLAGGGIAVFYFTIAFAYHQYQLFSQTAAFVIMIGITVFAVALSLLYNKIELSVIALIGGFLAPFLVSTGSGNYVTLFSYLLLLSTGILVISFFKKWPLLLVLSFIFSWLIFDGWLIKDYAWGGAALPFRNAMLFATAFYLLFLITSIINNLRTQRPFKAFDFSLLLTLTFSYYAQGMYILGEWNSGEYQGLFTMLLGFINLCLAWYLFKTKRGEKNLLYLLIGLTLTFVSLVAPVQLKGHSITLFWSAEAVLLYWLHQRSKIKIFKFSSLLILFCMALSLLLDWSLANDRAGSYLPLIFTNLQGIVTNIVAIGSLLCYAMLLGKNDESDIYFGGFKSTSAKKVFAAASLVLVYISLIFGVNLFFRQEQNFILPNTYHQLITYLLGAAALLIVTNRGYASARKFFLLITGACLAFYFGSTRFSNELIAGTLTSEYATAQALVHWASVACLLYLIYSVATLLRRNGSPVNKMLVWPLCLATLALFSMECRLAYLSLFATPDTIGVYNLNYAKAGLTITWALFSFCIIWLGLKFKNKTLRIIALSIFSVALLKLFLFDIRNINEGGKIAAFIMLGILLLVISFMYQRLKKIIIDNEEKTD